MEKMYNTNGTIKFYDEKEGITRIKCNNGVYNYFNCKKGELLSPYKAFDVAFDFNFGIGRVYVLTEGWNYIKPDGNYLSKEWFMFAGEFINGFARVMNKQGLWNYIKNDGTLLCSEWFIDICDFSKNYGKVIDKNCSWKYLIQDGTILSNIEEVKKYLSDNVF